MTDRPTNQTTNRPTDGQGPKEVTPEKQERSLRATNKKAKKMQRILKYYHDIFVSLLADTIHTDFDPKLSLGTLPFPLLLRNLEKKKPRNNMRL